MAHIHNDIAHLLFNDINSNSDLLINTSTGNQLKDYYYGNKLYATNFFEIIFFRTGKGQIWINDSKIELCDNSVIFLSPSQRHCYHMDVAAEDFRFVTFKEEFLYSFLADKYITFRLHYYYQTANPPILVTDNNQMNRYFEVLNEIEQKLTDKSSSALPIVNSLLYYLLVQLNHLYAKRYNIPESTGDNNIAYQFKELLEKNMIGKQTVADYAKKLCVSRITLNSAVKNQFGMTATELLKNKLIHNIKTDLVETNYSVSYLSEKYGFSEANHLMRFFKSQTGQTIGKYIEEYTKMMSAIH